MHRFLFIALNSTKQKFEKLFLYVLPPFYIAINLFSIYRMKRAFEFVFSSFSCYIGWNKKNEETHAYTDWTGPAIRSRNQKGPRYRWCVDREEFRTTRFSTTTLSGFFLSTVIALAVVGHRSNWSTFSACALLTRTKRYQSALVNALTCDKQIGLSWSSRHWVACHLCVSHINGGVIRPARWVSSFQLNEKKRRR